MFKILQVFDVCILTQKMAEVSFERCIILWLCITRTGNYKIHEFDRLKSILTAV